MIASNQRALCYLPAHTDPRELNLLRKVFARSRLRFREVSEKELSLPIGKLAGYFDCREQETAKDSSPLPEPVLVLCGLPSTKISELLEKMREAGAFSDCLQGVAYRHQPPLEFLSALRRALPRA